MKLFRHGEGPPREEYRAVLKYWESSEKQACGNCRWFGYPVVGNPICQIPECVLPDGVAPEDAMSFQEVDPDQLCLFWIRRKAR